MSRIREIRTAPRPSTVAMAKRAAEADLWAGARKGSEAAARVILDREGSPWWGGKPGKRMVRIVVRLQATIEIATVPESNSERGG